jgi:hypothetical protein
MTARFRQIELAKKRPKTTQRAIDSARKTGVSLVRLQGKLHLKKLFEMAVLRGFKGPH